MEKRKKKKKNVVLWSLFAALLTLAALTAVLLILDGRHNEIVMLGEDEVTLSYGEAYEDPGVEIRSVGRLFASPWEPVRVYALEEPDTSRLGRQELEYVIAERGGEKHLYRHITVEDNEAPVIELLPIPEGQEPSWMTGYIEPGYKAWDNVDGDMTAIVETTMLSDRLVYSVTDSSGNETVVERPLSGCMEAPEIELLDGAELTMTAAMSWEDPGFRVVDSMGRDLSEYVTVEGEVTPYRSGDYERVYTLTNRLGESVTAIRHIKVEPVRQSDTVYPDKKTIYLTFDDGPGAYTERLLNILARYNVKATFFVTNQFPDYQDLIGRAYREGHSIGVHTLTHKWDIYRSEQAYLNDFNAMMDIVVAQTGSTTKLFRFPGGSDNTISRNYCWGIMSALTETMTDLGYVYFDWNVYGGDSGETTDTNEVYRYVINGCVNDINVVLQHDIKSYSVDAVERIIVWGLNNGYQFLPLEESSFTAHKQVNN